MENIFPWGDVWQDNSVLERTTTHFTQIIYLLNKKRVNSVKSVSLPWCGWMICHTWGCLAVTSVYLKGGYLYVVVTKFHGRGYISVNSISFISYGRMIHLTYGCVSCEISLSQRGYVVVRNIHHGMGYMWLWEQFFFDQCGFVAVRTIHLKEDMQLWQQFILMGDMQFWL